MLVDSIVSHEDMQAHFTLLGRTGFEHRKKGKSWVWNDALNGVEFDRPPQVVNYRGIELSTADGDTFFPRLRSKWMDARYGINRKALETRADERICTIGNKLYFSQQKDEGCYRIKRRSDDFRMFVVEERCQNENPNQPAFDEFMIINKAGHQLEIARAT